MKTFLLFSMTLLFLSSCHRNMYRFEESDTEWISKYDVEDTIRFETNNGTDFTLNGDGSSEEQVARWFGINNLNLNNHVVLFSATLISGGIEGTFIFAITNSSEGVNINQKKILKVSTANSIIAYDNTTKATNAKIHTDVIDLTQAFGSTIADAVYTMEQAEAGSGIAWLKSYGFLTNDYYAYDSGSLQSMNVASRKVYDSNDTLVATYPLDSDLTLRGIVKKDANNNLYYDGDLYESDGSVTRRYGVVDLGSLTWTYEDSETPKRFRASLPTGPKLGGLVVCSKYLGTQKGAGALDDKELCISGTQAYPFLRIRDDSITDATVFKNAVNGQKLVYELATPTSETADAYENPQLVGSTEEFIDTRDVPIPVGQDSKYVNGNIYIKYLDSVTTGDIELADENAIIPLENTTYISSNGSASIDYWSKEV